MNKDQAKKMIRNTFEAAFNKVAFSQFIKELLNHPEKAPVTYQGAYIPDKFKSHIKRMDRIYKYNQGANKIDTLIVYLAKDSSLERARTMQRNFIHWFLNGSRGDIFKDAALVAFVAPASADWRFSLIKMDYQYEKTSSGKTVIKDILTPARRWSFLVGKNEKSHTAQKRLVDILADDEHAPTLSELENAFNIEMVTKEFFLQYRNLFVRTTAELEKSIKQSSKVKKDFQRKDIDTVNFAKKLLGQLVFLYFLQKKGWFGVARDTKWGDGPRDFLRRLFNKEHGEYNNFFNDILEHLFYDALRNERSQDDGYYGRFDCRIPFLNGGLFDPMNNYDWINADIDLPNTLFSNTIETLEGDVGDGILDVFDRFNFTVCEDEPLEKEVAIDPELLGKAYEKFNAIRSDNFKEFKQAVRSKGRSKENKFNKDFGVYYTPRAIVHYMCQQSLIHFLHRQAKQSQLKIALEMNDIETLVRESDMLTENEVNVINKQAKIKRGEQKTTTARSRLAKSIPENAKMLDNWLAAITICDPAVGSGAFPVGMMNEIVRIRKVLSVFFKEVKNDYELKRHCIEQSLYGVDIDDGAVEIAKLRLWLSLVVDEPHLENIRPLPNLDYKIVCGNALLGVPVADQFLHHKKLNALVELKQSFFSQTNPSKKNKLRKEINDTTNKLFKELQRGMQYKVSLDFQINFWEVFEQNNGFDVVLANPPYISLQKLRDKKLQSAYAKAGYASYNPRSDLYALFYERGIDLLCPHGHLCFITSNKWLRAGYGAKLRSYLSSHCNPLELLDFGGNKLFSEATVDCNILVVEKAENQGQCRGYTSISKAVADLQKTIAEDFAENSHQLPALNADNWLIANADELALKRKIERIGTPLKDWDVSINYGIKTGYNSAFIIDGIKRAELINADPKNAEIIKPILRGRDIRRYRIEFADLWLIFIPWHFPLHNDTDVKGASKKAEQAFRREYPTLYKHLLKFKDNLSNKRNQAETGIRYEWYALQRCAASYYKNFEKEKIIYGQFRNGEFTYTDKSFFLSSNEYMIVNLSIKPQLHYLLGVLNAKLTRYYQNLTLNSLGSATSIAQKSLFGNLPIPQPTAAQNKKMESLVDQMLVLHANYSEKNQRAIDALDKEIDTLVYQLYNLTNAEIKLIERI